MICPTCGRGEVTCPDQRRASFAVHDREPGLDLTYDNPPADAPRGRSAERIGEATIRRETQRP